MNETDSILAEAADAGRKGWAFSAWWLGCVCRQPRRLPYLTHKLWLEAREAHAGAWSGRPAVQGGDSMGEFPRKTLGP